MDKSTGDTVASSPPAFMTEGNDKAKEAAEKAEKANTREAAAQDKDEMAKRVATMQKATTRLKELNEYFGLIDRAVSGVLGQFVAVHPMGQTLDLFVDLEDQVTELEKTFKLVKGRISYAREVALPERMDAEESRTFTSADTGHRMSRTARLFASTKNSADTSVPDGGHIGPNNHGIEPGDFPELVGCPLGFVWLKQNGLGPLIKPTVNASSLSAAAKELMENGHELPEELFSVHMKDGVSITRKKAKR